MIRELLKSCAPLRRFLMKPMPRVVFLTIAAVFLPYAGAMDSSVSAERRVDELVAKMTVEEKAAQLCCGGMGSFIMDGKFSPEAARKLIPNGIGHLLSSRNPNAGPAVQDLQNWLRKETRLGIPAIIHGEAISGAPITTATTLPQQIGMGCTWNPDLLESNTAATCRQMRLVGMNQALSPMIDVGCNAHWGRNEEGFGEDSYLTSRMGLAFIRGLQGEDLRSGVAATVKHFAGYAQTKSVQDGFKISSSKSDDSAVASFREEVLTPFEVAVKEGNVASVMPGYHNVGEIPCSASKDLLQKILRQEWGFRGDVVSDYGAIGNMMGKTHFATNEVDALAKSMNAGIDVDLPGGSIFKKIPEALATGAIHEKILDQAVRHILGVKERLGLLDAKPIVIGDGTTPDLDTPADRQRAYESACQSLILLKNDGTLPLGGKIHSIAVIGPNADSAYSLLGDYTPQTMSEFWSRKPFDPNSPKLITLLAGLKNRVGDRFHIEFERGCDWAEGMSDQDAQIVIEDEQAKKAAKRPLQPASKPDWNRAIDIARNCDVVIAAMGENRFLGGETRDRSDITLPGKQQQLVQALIATGKPVVLVLLGGRANAIGEIETGCRAIIQGWYPGEEGGNALADLLLGNINPSGKLTVTMPRTSAQSPISYRQGYNPSDMPLYPFGHGLAYTGYDYGHFKIPNSAKTTDARIPVTFSLTNTGEREGAEVAQLYVSPPPGATNSPQLELKGFDRISLRPQESKTVTFQLSPQQLATYNPRKSAWEIHPATYQIKIGASSTDIRGQGSLHLTGALLSLKERGVFFSETEISMK